MTKMTLQDHIVDALTTSGYATVITGKSKKYITLRPLAGRTDRLLFAGKAGSLRAGRIFTESTPVLPQIKSFLIKASKGNRVGPLPGAFQP